MCVINLWIVQDLTIIRIEKDEDVCGASNREPLASPAIHYGIINSLSNSWSLSVSCGAFSCDLSARVSDTTQFSWISINSTTTSTQLEIKWAKCVICWSSAALKFISKWKMCVPADISFRFLGLFVHVKRENSTLRSYLCGLEKLNQFFFASIYLDGKAREACVGFKDGSK